MIGVGELLILLFVLVLAVPSAGLWIWVLLDLARHEPEGSNRTTWMMVVALTGVIGALAYLIVRRPQRLVESSQARLQGRS